MGKVQKKGWASAGLWAGLAAVAGGLGGAFGFDGAEISQAVAAIAGGIVALVAVFVAGRKPKED